MNWSNYLGEPVQAVGGINKVQGIVWENSSIKGARVSGDVNWGAGAGVIAFLFEIAVEVRQGLKDGVEVVGGEIVKVHPELRLRQEKVAAGFPHGFDYFFNVGQGVGPRGTSQVGYAQASGIRRYIHLFYGL